MGIVQSVVVFFVTWWIVLFAVLPWGVQSQLESGNVADGTEPGAPVRTNLKTKSLITTAIAFAIWLVLFLIVQFHLIDLGDPKPLV